MVVGWIQQLKGCWLKAALNSLACGSLPLSRVAHNMAAGFLQSKQVSEIVKDKEREKEMEAKVS